MRRRASVLTGVLVAASLAACSTPPPAPHAVLEDGDVSSLRADFNADAGKVRAIFLASPT